jgi:hypothetical protein
MSAGTIHPPPAAHRPSKAEAARARAMSHFEIEPELVAIYRLEAPDETERDPIKLLEVNRDTIPTGIMPLGFPPAPAQGVPYAIYLIEITPDEMDKIRAGDLPLPHGWRIVEEYRPAPVE